jgi:hypothetical protein
MSRGVTPVASCDSVVQRVQARHHSLGTFCADHIDILKQSLARSLVIVSLKAVALSFKMGSVRQARQRDVGLRMRVTWNAAVPHRAIRDV